MFECPYHPGAALVDDYRAGDVICTECGLVVGDRLIDVKNEWRSPESSRVGEIENRYLSTDLRTVDEEYRARMNATDRALLAAYRNIEAMAHRLSISGSVLDQAKVNFKEVYDKAGQKSHEALAGACLYIACRQIGAPRTFKEICAVCTVSKKEIGRCFKWIIKTLEKTVKTFSSEDFMMRFCFLLNLTKQVQAVSTYIAKRSVELDLVEGRSPISLAAAAIYMASQTSKTRKTAKEISGVTGVSEVTIHQSYKEMLPHAEELLPKQ